MVRPASLAEGVGGNGSTLCDRAGCDNSTIRINTNDVLRKYLKSISFYFNYLVNLNSYKKKDIPLIY
jgi:hypothetical protein